MSQMPMWTINDTALIKFRVLFIYTHNIAFSQIQLPFTRFN